MPTTFMVGASSYLSYDCPTDVRLGWPFARPYCLESRAGARRFYVVGAVEGRWSSRALERQLRSLCFLMRKGRRKVSAAMRQIQPRGELYRGSRIENVVPSAR